MAADPIPQAPEDDRADETLPADEVSGAGYGNNAEGYETQDLPDAD